MMRVEQCMLLSELMKAPFLLFDPKWLYCDPLIHKRKVSSVDPPEIYASPYCTGEPNN